MEITQHAKYTCSFCGKVNKLVYWLSIVGTISVFAGCHEAYLCWNLVLQEMSEDRSWGSLGLFDNCSSHRQICCPPSERTQRTVNSNTWNCQLDRYDCNVFLVLLVRYATSSSKQASYFHVATCAIRQLQSTAVEGLDMSKARLLIIYSRPLSNDDRSRSTKQTTSQVLKILCKLKYAGIKYVVWNWQLGLNDQSQLKPLGKIWFWILFLKPSG